MASASRRVRLAMTSRPASPMTVVSTETVTRPMASSRACSSSEFFRSHS